MWTDPAKNMRLARRLLALSMGVSEDELPADVDVEMSHDHETGELRVVGNVMVKGTIPYVTCKVSVGDAPPQSSDPQSS